jgi:hypothetical protein
MPDVIVTTQNTPINIEIGGPSTPTSNEVDPTVPNHVKSITQENINQWNSNNIGAEAIIRAAADTVLQENIDDEATTRAASDTTLQTNIDAEALARQAADTDLELSFESFAETLNTEESERTYADSSLQSAINDEVTNRTSADTTLQGNIDAESIARADADSTLQTAIDDEVTNRTNADTTLQGNIDTETIAREDADVILQDYIDAEKILRGDADNVLQGNINAKEPSITGGLETEFWSGLKTWRNLATDVRAVILTGLSILTSTAITATDSIIVALGKLQAQISLKQDNITATTSADYYRGDKTMQPVSGLPVSTAQQTALNLKEDSSNKQTNLNPSATKFPTVDAVNDGLSTKQKTITSGTAAPSGGVDGDIYLQYI